MNPRIVIITTSPESLRKFFQAQIRFLVSEGFDVHTISSPGKDLDECHRNISVPMHEIAMQRRISPFADLLALLRLSWKLRRLRPDIVHTHTPKAGLLGMIAARMARVPIRIYTINGLRLSTCSGLRRAILTAADKLGCSLATDVLCVSDSLRQEAVALGVCPAFKTRTLGHGASHGVDTSTFDPDRRNSVDRRSIRSRYGLPQNAVVLSYIGRIVRDKGIVELSAAWRVLREEFPDLWLLLCGTPGPEDPLSPDLMRALRTDPRICLTGEIVRDMPGVYAAIDICVLPSYREGLPNVVIESQSMRIPVVATRISGTVDAVRDGVTGFLVEPRNHLALARALRPLIQDDRLRSQIGAAGRTYVGQHFLEQRVSELLAAEYRRLLALRLPSHAFPPHLAPQPHTAYNTLKRAIDVFVAAVGLTVTSPLLVLIGIGMRGSTRSTALFRQTRIGLMGHRFSVYKFRTMTDAREVDGHVLPDAQRLTALGRVLRATSLDELPQFWNVLRGEMTLVGPRPLLPEYLRRYTPFQNRRHEVKPGITGWAQVKGRNALTWERKFELDVWYVDHRSLSLDAKILWMTLLKVVRGEGISQQGHVTMAEFEDVYHAARHTSALV